MHVSILQQLGGLSLCFGAAATVAHEQHQQHFLRTYSHEDDKAAVTTTNNRLLVVAQTCTSDSDCDNIPCACAGCPEGCFIAPCSSIDPDTSVGTCEQFFYNTLQYDGFYYQEVCNCCVSNSDCHLPDGSTNNLICNQGVCVVGCNEVTDCTFPPGDLYCYEATCNLSTCEYTQLAEGTTCGSQSQGECDASGICISNECTDPSECNDDDPCTDDSCDWSITGNVCNNIPKICNDDNICTTDSCDAVTGECVFAPEDGVPCDDADLCNGDEKCSNGQCAHVDGSDPCAHQGECYFDPVCTQVQLTTSCSSAEKSARTPCSNERMCDGFGNCVECVSDSDCASGCDGCNCPDCYQGLCGGPTGTYAKFTQFAIDCIDEGGWCYPGATADSPRCGVCGECNTSDDCEGEHVCDNTTTTIETGLCAPPCSNDPSSCSHLDGPCMDGTCNPNTGLCEAFPKQEFTSCGDPSTTICSNPDTCDADGVCQPRHEPTSKRCRTLTCQYANCDGAGNCPAANVVEPEGTPCGDSTNNDCTNPDTCDGFGACQSNHEEDNSECSDGVACNGVETCQAGVCQPGTAVDCSGKEDQCNFGVCDQITGTCSAVPKPAGTACGDSTNTDCTNADTCDGFGACQSNHEEEGTACGDSSTTICSNPDTCDADGVCQPRHEPTSKICRSETCHFDAYCDGAGNCPAANVLEPEGTVCGDQAETDCDSPDTCDGAGVCQSNHAAVGTACGDFSTTICSNADTCDGFGACQPNHAPDNSECSDGDACNGVETCQAGVCQAGTAVDCSGKDDQCNVGVCNSSIGACSAEPANEGEACDSGVCNSGVCTAATVSKYICHKNPQDASLICDTGSSFPDSICASAGASCGGPRTCHVATTCQDTSGPTGCTTDPECDDGLFCNGAETCSGGSCQAGSDPCPDQDCDEDADTCISSPGCSGDPECDDGVFCNGAETCSGGSCQAGSDPCPGQDCDEASDVCVGSCSSAGTSCNSSEECCNGKCKGNGKCN